MSWVRRLFGIPIAGALWLSLTNGQSIAAEITVILESPQNIPVIVISGMLLEGDERKFTKTALEHDRALVAFDSPGGNLLAGIGIGKAIRLKEFVTAVGETDECASACGLAWLGGIKRLAHPSARIGFHAAYVENEGQASESGSGNALVGAYLNQLGLPQSAIIYLTSAPPSGMQWLPLKEAKSYGIDLEIFEPSNPSTSAPGNLSSTMTRLNGFDVIGFDLPSMPLRDISLENCEAACAGEPSCMAFTYNVPRKACFLKNSASRVLRNAIAVAGYRAELEDKMFVSSMTILERTDLPGNDFQKLSISDFEQCLSTCEANPRCKAFTFVKRQSVCWLKDGVSPSLENRRAVSGVRGK